MNESLLEKIHRIRAFVFDVDGVFTDGRLLLLDDGEMLRSMNIKDGYAVKLAIKNLYHVGIISGSGSDAIQRRLENLGIEDIHLFEQNKKSIFEKFILDHGINPEHVLYMGDDILDIDPMRMAGIAACPADAVRDVREISDYICTRNGGDACVREVIELVMRNQKNWPV